MSSTAITFFKENSFITKQRILKGEISLKPFFIVLFVSVCVALGAYIFAVYTTASHEQAIKDFRGAITALEEENSLLETQISQQDRDLQLEEQLVKMELIKTQQISYIEKVSENLVLAPMNR